MEQYEIFITDKALLIWSKSMSTLLVNYWHHKQPCVNIVESLKKFCR